MLPCCRGLGGTLNGPGFVGSAGPAAVKVHDKTDSMPSFSGAGMLLLLLPERAGTGSARVLPCCTIGAAELGLPVARHAGLAGQLNGERPGEEAPSAAAERPVSACEPVHGARASGSDIGESSSLLGD